MSNRDRFLEQIERMMDPSLVPPPVPPKVYADPTTSRPPCHSSLWDLIGLNVVMANLWPLLSDRDAINAMIVNHATLKQYNQYPIKRVFTVQPSASKDKVTVRAKRLTIPVHPVPKKRHCNPSIRSIQGVSIDRLDCLAHLPDVTSVGITTTQNINKSMFPDRITELIVDGSGGKDKHDENSSSQSENQSNSQSTIQSNNQSKVVYDLTSATFPSKLQILVLHHYPLSSPPAKGVFPSSLKYLDYSGCNQPLAKGVLPAGLEVLILPPSYTQPFDKGLIPSSLRRLVMNCNKWNHAFKKDTFPSDSKLEELIMDKDVHSFDSPFAAGSLPDSLKVLNLSGCDKFDQQFRKGVLPRSLKELYLGKSWNRPLSKAMWMSCLDLEVLSLRECKSWNHQIKTGMLPDSLKSLYLPVAYDEWLKGSTMPSTLRYLRINNQKVLRGDFPEECEIVIKKGEVNRITSFVSERAQKAIYIDKGRMSFKKIRKH